MKKILLLLLAALLTTCLVACNEKNDLPLPEISDGVRGDLGIDKNINEETIDKYLNRNDAVYRDMRMLIDEAEYENIGGDSYLSGFVKGFEVVPYPYLCSVEGLPPEVGSYYNGPSLFTHVNDTYESNYKESLEIIESLFPKDKYIFLMCGGGGYAGMTKQLLVGLGWDENKIYNTGGYWYYHGENDVKVKYSENGEDKYNFALVDYHNIIFDTLTPNGGYKPTDEIEDDVDKSDFIRLKSLEELNVIENDKKTIPLFVFLSGCPTCAKFLPIVKEFAQTNDIEMYSIDLNDIWGTSNSITDRIKYAPSMFIYKDGQVLAYLDSSKNEDKVYYENIENLTSWISENIDINLFEKCSSCTIK